MGIINEKMRIKGEAFNRLHPVVYRVCNSIDVERIYNGNGILAKDPTATAIPEKHVAYGSRKGYRDQWISTTTSCAVAGKYILKPDHDENDLIVKIDLVKLQAKNTIKNCVRASDLKLAEMGFRYNFGTASQEFVFEGEIPFDCLEVITKAEFLKAYNSLGAGYGGEQRLREAVQKAFEK